MKIAAENLVADALQPALALKLGQWVQGASDKVNDFAKQLGPTGQSRQLRGSLLRQFFWDACIPDADLQLDRVAINKNFDFVDVHDDPLTVDLLQVGGFYLHFTRVRDSLRFMSRPSKTQLRFLMTAETGRPLFPDLTRPLVLVLFYVLDDDRETVKQVGIGVASGNYSRIQRVLIPDLLAYGSQAVVAEGMLEAERRHGLKLKGHEGGDGAVDERKPGDYTN